MVYQMAPVSMTSNELEGRSLLLIEHFLTAIPCETQHELTNIERRAVLLQ